MAVDSEYVGWFVMMTQARVIWKEAQLRKRPHQIGL